jgi:peptidoglycan/LPS O-acetylase OafA/YrhL
MSVEQLVILNHEGECTMSTNATPTEKHTGPREWLFWAAIALAVGEFIDAFFVDVPAPGIIYAIVVAACAGWLRSRGGRAPIIILLVLAALELAAIIFIYPTSDAISDDPSALWPLAIFVLLLAAVVILAGLALRRAQKA